MVPDVGQGGGTGSGGAPPRQQKVGADDELCLNPCTIQRLRLLLGENTRGVCWNVVLTILGGAAFCKSWNLGFSCFSKGLQKGSHTQPLAAMVDKVSAAMAAAWSPVVGAVGIT